MADLRAVSVAYRPDGGRLLFENLDLHAGAGEVIGITGNNGEGKTSLMRILAGLLAPDRGTVLLDGDPILARSRRETARAVGYLPQFESTPFPITAWQMVLMGRYPHMMGRRLAENGTDREEAEVAMRTAGVYHLRDGTFMHLSGGERMRVRIARLIAQRPRTMLLDEPTTYLDDDFRQTLAGLVRLWCAGGCSAVVVSHDLEFLEQAGGRIYHLEAAKLRPKMTMIKEKDQ